MRRVTTISESLFVRNSLTSVEDVHNTYSLESALAINGTNVADIVIKTNAVGHHSKPMSSSSFTDTTFYVAFSPLIFWLKVSGLYHTRSTELGKKISLGRLYCWLITFVAWTGWLMELTVLRLVSSINIKLIFLLISISFGLLCTTNVTTSLIHGHRQKYIAKFFLGFERLNQYGGPFTSPLQVRRLAMASVISTWLVYVCSSILFGYIFYATTLMDILTEGFGLPATSTFMRTLLMMFCSVMELLWLFPNCTELCMSILLFQEYRLFCKSFTKKIDRFGKFQGCLETERSRYVEMSRIVDAADKILAFHHAASFLCNIANLCMFLYVIAYYHYLDHVYIFVFWMLLFIADIAVVCISGILVNVGV